MSKATRGRWAVRKGITYRVGDGFRRAEPGDVVDDLDDVTEADFRMLQDLGAIELAKPAKEQG